MRDRLIELLQSASDKYINLLHFEKEILADYLLENGVVVLEKNKSVEDMIELLKAQIAVYEGWVNKNGK